MMNPARRVAELCLQDLLHDLADPEQDHL